MRDWKKSEQAHLLTMLTPFLAPEDDWKITHKKSWEMNRKFISREIRIRSDSDTRKILGTIHGSLHSYIPY